MLSSCAQIEADNMAERKLSARAGAYWQAALRLTVRNSTATGWTLREQRGIARLEVRHQGERRRSGGGPSTTGATSVSPCHCAMRMASW